MSFTDEMQNLREEIEKGKEVRTRRLKELKSDVKAFMGETAKRREELKQELTQARQAFWGPKKSKKGGES